MKPQTLEQQFYDLKAEILKHMKPQTYRFIYFKDGSGFALTYDDQILYKLYPMTGAPPDSCDVKEIIEAYRIFIKKDLSHDECLNMVIARFQEILKELK